MALTRLERVMHQFTPWTFNEVIHAILMMALAFLWVLRDKG